MLTVSVCPLTMGAITSMTDAGFNRSCRVRNKDQDIRNGYGSSVGTSTIYDEYCKQCGGEYPPELTIIHIEDLEMNLRKTANCEICKKIAAKTMVIDGKKCCATCEPIRRNAKLRGSLMLEQIREFHPDLLAVPDAGPGVDRSSRAEIHRAQLEAAKNALETATGINKTLTDDYAALEQMVKDLRESNGNLREERMEMLDNIDALKSNNGRIDAICSDLRVIESNVKNDLAAALKDNLSLIQEIEQLKQPGWISATEEETLPAGSADGLAGFGGYDALSEVLHAALTQAAIGKGKERHANDEPFEEQDICTITRSEGHGFTRGQAIKKIKEAKRLDRDAAIRELLGAINYLAADVIVLGEVA